MTPRQRRVLFWGSVAFFFIAVMPIMLYSFGYRFSFETFKILRAGGLVVSSTPSTGTKIYINGKLTKETTLLSRNLFLQGLTPRTYSIRIEKDGYFTWEKSLPVTPERVTEIHALLIKQNPEDGTVILRGDYHKIALNPREPGTLILSDSRGVKRYYSVGDKTFLTNQTQTASSTETLSDNAKEIISQKHLTTYDYDASGERITWWDVSDIWIRWLKGEEFLPLYTESAEIRIFKSDQAIRDVQFYPGQDAVIAAYANQLSVIELDGRAGHKIYPLYKGKEPSFVLSPREKKIYILDDGNVIALPLG